MTEHPSKFPLDGTYVIDTGGEMRFQHASFEVFVGRCYRIIAGDIPVSVGRATNGNSVYSSRCHTKTTARWHETMLGSNGRTKQ